MNKFHAAFAVCLAMLVLTCLFSAQRKVQASHSSARGRTEKIAFGPAISTRRVARAEATEAARARRSPHSPEALTRSDRISALLGRSHGLGPAARGEEDDARCALDRLLTDRNAESVVTQLAADDSNTPFGLAALARWAHVAPAAAAVWLAARSEATPEQACVLAREMAADPALISAYSAQLAPGPWRISFLEAASMQLHASPADALALIHQLPPGDAQSRALRSLVLDWTSSDRTAANAWIAAQAEGPMRDQLVAIAAEAQAAVDPLGAIAWSTASIHSDGVFNVSLQTILDTWSVAQPQAATEFIRRISGSSLGQAAIAADDLTLSPR